MPPPPLISYPIVSPHVIQNDLELYVANDSELTITPASECWDCRHMLPGLDYTTVGIKPREGLMYAGQHPTN